VKVGVNNAGTGVVVTSGCVGGMDVGGRKGVGVGWGAHAEAEKMTGSRSRIRVRKVKRGFEIGRASCRERV